MSNESTPPADQGRRKDKGKLQQVNKCLNEKKRREQENLYMEELAEFLSTKLTDIKSYSMIKPDKCAILQETVTQIRRIKDEETGVEGNVGSGGASSGSGGASSGSGSGAASSSGSSGGSSDVVQQSQVSSSKPSPNILASDVIGPLLLEALDGFLFMVTGDGRLGFVSQNVNQYLRYTQDDLIGKSIFSIVDQVDHATFRKCLEPILARSNIATSSDAQGNRSQTFECNMIIKTNDDETEEASISSLHGSRMERMQILAIWQQYPQDREADTSSLDSECQSYLACIARRMGFAEKTVSALGLEQFTTKQDLNGKILDCDTSATIQGEPLCREFVDTNILDFCHPNDKERLKKHHDEVLKQGSNTSGIYRFRMQNRFVFVQTKSKLFKNPTTNHPEFIMSTHSIVRDCEGPTELKGSLQASLMQAIIGGQSAASNTRDMQRGCHGNRLGRVSSVSSLSQMLMSDEDLPNDAFNVNEFVGMMSSNPMPENSAGLGGMGGASVFQQQNDGTSHGKLNSLWGMQFQGASNFPGQQHVGSSQMLAQPRRGMKRRATSPASASALRSPGNSQRSPVGYYSTGLRSPATKRLTTPSPLANYGQQQSYGATNKNSSYLFPEEPDLSSLLDSVQGDGMCQLDDHHLDGARAIRSSMTPRPISQGSGFDWESVSPPVLPPLQALQQLQVNSISTFKDDIHVFQHKQRRSSKRDQNGSMTSATSLSGGATTPGCLSRSNSRPFQDLRLRELLINDDDTESLSGSSIGANDSKNRDAKGLGGSTSAGSKKSSQRSTDLESTKSPQWLMNPSPQQPQSTTFMDDLHPDSSSNKDSLTNGQQSPSTKNKILKQLLSQEDDEDEDGEADPGSSSASFGGGRSQAPSAMPVLRVLAKLEGAQSQPQPVVSSLPDTSASPREQEREVEPTSNSGAGSSNNLLKKLLNSTDEICKNDSKIPKHTELLQKLLSDNSDDVADSNTSPIVESTSSVEMETENKATSSSSSSHSSSSSSDTSPVVTEEKLQFRRQNDPKGEKLKLMLKSLWENDGGSSVKTRAATSTFSFKSPKTSVDEAAADSTDFEAEAVAPPHSSSSSLSTGMAQPAAGNDNKNKLLLKLLQGGQPAVVPVLNTGSISAVATVTPQTLMAKKAELMASGGVARTAESRPARDHSSSESDLVGLEQAAKGRSAASPVVGRHSDVNWLTEKAKAAAEKLRPPVPAPNVSIIEKLLVESEMNDDNQSLQDYFSGNSLLDGLMNNADLEKLLDEVTSDAAPSEALGSLDDNLILSTIEQYIMSSSMSILEVDSLLQIGGDRGPDADPNEEVAIGEIQQQLMSMETISSSSTKSAATAAAGGGAGGASSAQQPQFITLPDQNLMGGSVARSTGTDVNGQVNKASTISNLMKEFQMLESQESAALNQPLAQQPKQSGGQSRHVMNQLQKILTSRNQEKNTLPQQRQEIGLGTINARILGTNRLNSPGLKSPATQPTKTGFTLMETSSNDAGLVANLSEMMNVTHAPNVVAPPSGFRGSSAQPRLMSQSSVEGNLGQGQSVSDLQRTLTSQYQWNQRGVSIMAGGALVQTNQTGLLPGSRPDTAVMPSLDEMTLIGDSLHGSESGDVIDELLATVLSSPRLPSQQQQQQQQQLQMRMMQNQLQQQQRQQQGAVSELLGGALPSNRFRDPLISRGALKLSSGSGCGTPLQSPMNSSPRNNTVSPMMSPSIGSMSSGMISPMLDAANNLLSPSLGANMPGGSPFSGGMMSPSLGMNSVFGGGHKTLGSYVYNDPQVDSKGSVFGTMSIDRPNSNRGNISTPLIAGILHRDQGKPDLGGQASKAPGSGTSKDTKQALKLSIQSRTSSSQMLQQQLQQQQQQQQRSPGSAGITSTSKADRISQYYLQTGSELLENQDDCSALVDCFSPLSDSYVGQQHNASSGGTMTSDSLLDMLGPRSQQLQQQQQPREMALHALYKRQGSLSDQRLLASKKLQEVQGMGAKQGAPQMSLGINQHLDQVLGVQQQQHLGDGDAQLQQLMMQAPEMSQSQSRHMMGFRPQQQPKVTGAKQQVTSINQIQHLGTMQPGGQQHLTLMQQQQPAQHLQLGMMQQSGQHQQQLVTLQQQQQQQHQQQQLGMIQQMGHHQQLPILQQQGQQQLAALHQQGQQQLPVLHQQGQHQQLAALQQQGQHQQLAALQQQQQQGQQQQQQMALLQQQGQHQGQQHQGLGQQSSSQNQQLVMMRQQRIQQHLRQQGGPSEMQQQLGAGGGGTPLQQQRLAPQQQQQQGMSSAQSIGQWGGGMQRQQATSGQPENQGLSMEVPQKVPQSPSEFTGRKAEILQQLMAGIQQHQQQQQQMQPLGGGGGNIQDANSRTSVLQSGGGALQESNDIGVYLQNHIQLMSGSTSQCNNSQLMGSGYDTMQAGAVGGGAQHHFLQQQQQQQVQPQQDTGGLNGNLMTDDARRRRDDALLYPNESLKKGRDEGRSQNDDFFRVGLQKLINEHVHKDSTTARMRTGNMVPGASVPNARKSNPGFLGKTLSLDSASSMLDSKPTDALQSSPQGQVHAAAGTRPSLDEQLQGMLQTPTGAPRPGRTALLEKLLSDDSG